MRVGVPLSVPLLLCAIALVLQPARAAAPAEPGELWETTVQTTMQGMSLPVQTQQVCQPQNAEAGPPMPDDGNCEMTDLKTSGGKVSWRVTCKQPETMTGTGEMVYDGPDRYSGSMIMKSSQGEMVMKLSGRRLGKPCDAGAVRRMATAAQASAAQGMAAFCRESADALNLFAFSGPEPQCPDPEDKQAFCRKLRSEEGYSRLDAPGAPLSDAAALCGVDPAALRKELCAGAARDESLEFLVKKCPDEATLLAQRECAGRKYTELTGSKYQSFCGSYAAELLAGGAPGKTDPPPADAASDPLGKAKKKLKGLFGR